MVGVIVKMIDETKWINLEGGMAYQYDEDKDVIVVVPQGDMGIYQLTISDVSKVTGTMYVKHPEGKKMVAEMIRRNSWEQMGT